MKQQAVVGGTLHIGLSAQGVNSTSGPPHVTQKELDHGHHPDVLRSHRVLCPAHGVHDGAGLIHSAGSRVGFPHLFEISHRGAGDGRNLFRGVARVVFFHQLENATRVFEGEITLGHTVFILFEGPVGLVVLPFLGVVSRKKAVFEFILATDYKAGVGVMGCVFLMVLFVADDIVHHPAQKGDVRARPQRRINIRFCGCAGKARIHADEGGPLFHGLRNPLHGDGMVFRRIGSHDQDAVGVANVDPVVGHRAASERLCQSRNSGAVSDTSLVFDIDQTQGAHDGLEYPAFLVVQRR